MTLYAVGAKAELEDVTDALLLTGGDDSNALAAAALRTELGHGRVFHAAPVVEEMGLLAPPDDEGILGGEGLTAAALGRGFEAGALGPAGCRRAFGPRCCDERRRSALRSHP